MENKSIVAALIVIVFLVGILFFTSKPVENSRTQTATDTQSNAQLTELKKETLKEGTGDRQVQTGDLISVHYVGTLLNGTKFDSSRDRGTPFEFTVGSGVIEGWSEGVVGMKQGETIKLSIPAELGYGAQAVGSIPANSDLYFEIELMEF